MSFRPKGGIPITFDITECPLPIKVVGIPHSASSVRNDDL